MAVPFPDIDPYKELQVSQSDAPPIIKKAYYKLCLRYHPDKIQDESEKLNVENKTRFERIQFSYSILGDVKKRSRYDQTGSLEDSGFLDEDFDWKDFFAHYSNREVTKEMIEQDMDEYQGSEEESKDILESMEFYKGDFLKLFEVIPHLEFDEVEEERIFSTVKNLVKEKKLEEYSKWKKYTTNRNREVKRMLKKVKRESKEAEKLLKKMQAKTQAKDKSLEALIRAKHGAEKDPFEALIAKYGGRGDNEKKVKRNRNEYDLDDREFERVQKDLMNKKKK
ncbi:DEKNAAC101352 [Brettanomyces naardenensis]|uniref:DEKNAAC101352 n=1 Tax=Brettanomyces naardenensis TaxID=13370 RepID=A0A448YHV2_BRENA|nr:DEKNAAC101352 [Brettanomyces naardenensis]